MTLRHSLLQKLQLKYTRSLVDRFKIPLDISIVDNTSDGLVSILFLAWEARYLYDVKMPKNTVSARLSSCEVYSIFFFFNKFSSLGRCVEKTGSVN